jgi:hypothetical protein
MANKGELVQLIKDWMTTDNEIRTINKELRARKETNHQKEFNHDIIKILQWRHIPGS